MVRKYRVSGFTLHFQVSPRTGLLENIVLVLEVEGDPNRILKMQNIPLEIALELEKFATTESQLNIENNDFRMSIFDVLMEIPNVEKMLRQSIKEIVINKLHRDRNVYSAEVHLVDTYSGKPAVVEMIPSHALLLSVMGNIPVYISEDLLMDRSQEPTSPEDYFNMFIDDEILDPDEMGFFDEWDDEEDDLDNL